MRKRVFFVICIFVFVFGSIFVPSVNAETYTIGEKVTESDIGIDNYRWYAFSSGAMIEADKEYMKYIPLIFDNNLSTGIAQNFSSKLGSMVIDLFFPNYLNVTNITIKPNFGGNSSLYYISLHVHDSTIRNFVFNNFDEEKTFQLHLPIRGFHLSIIRNNTDYFYFNDVIINYTPMGSSQNPTNYQQQFNQINQEINIIKGDIIEIKGNITSEYNDSVLKNELQIQIDQLNLEINALEENITEINNNLPFEYNDSALTHLINDLTKELTSTKEDITKIRNNLSSEYDDSGVKSSIFNLESNNVFMSLKIVNLTIKIENLTSELEKISTEVQNLQSKEGVEDSGSEKEDRLYQYGTNIVFGIIIIVLLIVILGLAMMVLKNKGQQGSKPTLENGIYSNVMHELLFDNKQQNANASNAELNVALENKYKTGAMSDPTYNSLKNLIQNLEHSQQMKK